MGTEVKLPDAKEHRELGARSPAEALAAITIKPIKIENLGAQAVGDAGREIRKTRQVGAEAEGLAGQVQAEAHSGIAELRNMQRMQNLSVGMDALYADGQQIKEATGRDAVLKFAEMAGNAYEAESYELCARYLAYGQAAAYAEMMVIDKGSSLEKIKGMAQEFAENPSSMERPENLELLARAQLETHLYSADRLATNIEISLGSGKIAKEEKTFVREQIGKARLEYMHAMEKLLGGETQEAAGITGRCAGRVNALQSYVNALNEANEMRPPQRKTGVSIEVEGKEKKVKLGALADANLAAMKDAVEAGDAQQAQALYGGVRYYRIYGEVRRFHDSSEGYAGEAGRRLQLIEKNAQQFLEQGRFGEALGALNLGHNYKATFEKSAYRGFAGDKSETLLEAEQRIRRESKLDISRDSLARTRGALGRAIDSIDPANVAEREGKGLKPVDFEKELRIARESSSVAMGMGRVLEDARETRNDAVRRLMPEANEEDVRAIARKELALTGKDIAKLEKSALSGETEQFAEAASGFGAHLQKDREGYLARLDRPGVLAAYETGKESLGGLKKDAAAESEGLAEAAGAIRELAGDKEEVKANAGAVAGNLEKGSRAAAGISERAGAELERERAEEMGFSFNRERPDRPGVTPEKEAEDAKAMKAAVSRQQEIFDDALVVSQRTRGLGLVGEHAISALTVYRSRSPTTFRGWEMGRVFARDDASAALGEYAEASGHLANFEATKYELDNDLREARYDLKEGLGHSSGSVALLTGEVIGHEEPVRERMEKIYVEPRLAQFDIVTGRREAKEGELSRVQRQIQATSIIEQQATAGAHVFVAGEGGRLWGMMRETEKIADAKTSGTEQRIALSNITNSSEELNFDRSQAATIEGGVHFLKCFIPVVGQVFIATDVISGGLAEIDATGEVGIGTIGMGALIATPYVGKGVQLFNASAGIMRAINITHTGLLLGVTAHGAYGGYEAYKEGNYGAAILSAAQTLPMVFHAGAGVPVLGKVLTARIAPGPIELLGAAMAKGAENTRAARGIPETPIATEGRGAAEKPAIEPARKARAETARPKPVELPLSEPEKNTRAEFEPLFTAREENYFFGRGGLRVEFTDAQVNEAARIVNAARKGILDPAALEKIQDPLVREKATALAESDAFKKAAGSGNARGQMQLGLALSEGVDRGRLTDAIRSDADLRFERAGKDLEGMSKGRQWTKEGIDRYSMDAARSRESAYEIADAVSGGEAVEKGLALPEGSAEIRARLEKMEARRDELKNDPQSRTNIPKRVALLRAEKEIARLETELKMIEAAKKKPATAMGWGAELFGEEAPMGTKGEAPPETYGRPAAVARKIAPEIDVEGVAENTNLLKQKTEYAADYVLVAADPITGKIERRIVEWGLMDREQIVAWKGWVEGMGLKPYMVYVDGKTGKVSDTRLVRINPDRPFNVDVLPEHGPGSLGALVGAKVRPSTNEWNLNVLSRAITKDGAYDAIVNPNGAIMYVGETSEGIAARHLTEGGVVARLEVRGGRISGITQMETEMFTTPEGVAYPAPIGGKFVSDGYLAKVHPAKGPPHERIMDLQKEFRVTKPMEETVPIELRPKAEPARLSVVAEPEQIRSGGGPAAKELDATGQWAGRFHGEQIRPAEAGALEVRANKMEAALIKKLSEAESDPRASEEAIKSWRRLAQAVIKKELRSGRPEEPVAAKYERAMSFLEKNQKQAMQAKGLSALEILSYEQTLLRIVEGGKWSVVVKVFNPVIPAVNAEGLAKGARNVCANMDALNALPEITEAAQVFGLFGSKTRAIIDAKINENKINEAIGILNKALVDKGLYVFTHESGTKIGLAKVVMRGESERGKTISLERIEGFADPFAEKGLVAFIDLRSGLTVLDAKVPIEEAVLSHYHERMHEYLELSGYASNVRNEGKAEVAGSDPVVFARELLFSMKKGAYGNSRGVLETINMGRGREATKKGFDRIANFLEERGISLSKRGRPVELAEVELALNEFMRAEIFNASAPRIESMTLAYEMVLSGAKPSEILNDLWEMANSPNVSPEYKQAALILLEKTELWKYAIEIKRGAPPEIVDGGAHGGRRYSGINAANKLLTYIDGELSSVSGKRLSEIEEMYVKQGGRLTSPPEGTRYGRPARETPSNISVKELEQIEVILIGCLERGMSHSLVGKLREKAHEAGPVKATRTLLDSIRAYDAMIEAGKTKVAQAQRSPEQVAEQERRALAEIGREDVSVAYKGGNDERLRALEKMGIDMRDATEGLQKMKSIKEIRDALGTGQERAILGVARKYGARTTSLIAASSELRVLAGTMEGEVKQIRKALPKEMEEAFDLVTRGRLGERIGSIPGYGGYSITQMKKLGGMRGVFEVTLQKGAERKNAYVKLEDLEPAILGKRLAETTGLFTSEIYAGYEYDTGLKVNEKPVMQKFGVMEDINDYSGRSVRMRVPTGKTGPAGMEETRIEEVEVVGTSMLLSEVLVKPNSDNPVHVAFYKMLSTPEGRVDLFRAWNRYHEMSRRVLLGDRHMRNSVAVLVKRAGSEEPILTFQPIDMDWIAAFGAREGGAPNFIGMHRDYRVASEDFIYFLFKASGKSVMGEAAPDGSRFGPENPLRFEDMVPEFRQARPNFADDTPLGEVAGIFKSADGKPYGAGGDATDPKSTGNKLGTTVDHGGRNGMPVINADGRFTLYSDELIPLAEAAKGDFNAFWDNVGMLSNPHGRLNP